eukprot:3416175-Amphidinium_carterae.1
MAMYELYGRMPTTSLLHHHGNLSHLRALMHEHCLKGEFHHKDHGEAPRNCLDHQQVAIIMPRRGCNAHTHTHTGSRVDATWLK